MTRNDLLEMIVVEVANENLKNELLNRLFGIGVKSELAIPRLKEHQHTLDRKGVHERMMAVAGGTGTSVAKILGISCQAWNNQKRRNTISARSIIGLHLATGVSVDWLLGSWSGKDYEYERMDPYAAPPATIDIPARAYLTLVEVYDQQTGVNELKWCRTKQQIAFDDEGQMIPDDYGALLSLIVRYRAEAATPERMKSATGRKRHFQVRRVLGYVLGDPKLVSQLDMKVKKLTIKYQADLLERSGKTEFRVHSSGDECLRALQTVADQHGVPMVLPEPEKNTIAWDFLIGAGSKTPHKWVLDKLFEDRGRKQLVAANLTKSEKHPLAWTNVEKFRIIRGQRKKTTCSCQSHQK